MFENDFVFHADFVHMGETKFSVPRRALPYLRVLPSPLIGAILTSEATRSAKAKPVGTGSHPPKRQDFFSRPPPKKVGSGSGHSELESL